MCGILGFFEVKSVRPRADLPAIGKKMADALAHRGPDDSGLWLDPDHPLLLAQRRLAIIDLSPEGRQPMESHTGRYMLVFNGEIYNFQGLRQELERLGQPFRGRSDTEVMLAAFEQWGVNQALQKLNGMFAFVLWDRETRQIHMARDRLGKKPLYVGWAGTALVFGSELKALRAHPDFARDVNRDTLALYMRYGCVPAPHSIYQDTWQIPAGCRLTLDARTLGAGDNLAARMEPYWNHARIVEEARQKTPPASDAQAIDEFESLLKTCVRDRMVSDVPLGAFLSGGIDSSTIVALMQQLSGSRIKTFSIGFHEAGYDEAAHARAVADHLGTDHHEMYVTAQDALDVIPQLPVMYDEPFADISQIPTYLVSKFARTQVTVALSGDGGDEMLGGYARHVATPELWRRVGWWPRPARQALAGLIRSLPVTAWNRLVPRSPRFGDRLYKVAGLLPLEGTTEIYEHLVSTWPDPARLVIGGTEKPFPLTQGEWQPRGLGFAERMMFDDALSYLPNDVLVKVDRASMAASLECRAPLLDPRVFDYAWRLPLDMKVRGGKGKWLLREVLARHVPRALFERPKQGFSVPVSSWLRGSLHGWAQDLLAHDALARQGYLDADLVQDSWKRHEAGAVEEAQKLWTVLMFQSWLARQ